MKIHGVEGLSPETLRDEVSRGGRFVIYTYCVSVLVMTFKRPTGIYYIKPGKSPVAAGLPFVGVSFLLGWWGFPWGPIYSIETIYKNLCGGIDVTHDVVNQIAPAPAAATPPPVAATPEPATLRQTTAPAQGNQSAPERPAAPHKGFNFRVAATMVLAVCVAALLGISGYCYYRQTHMQVVLVSGLATPYTVKLNGEEHTLQPYSARVLTMSEGGFTLEDASGSSVVGSPRTATLSIPFLDHLGKEKLAIINPDEVAILLNVAVPYYTDASARRTEQFQYDTLSNEWSRMIDKPDYILDPAPQEIDMPSGQTMAVKHRLQNVPKADVGWALDRIKEQDGYPAVRNYIMRLAKWRTDEDFLTQSIIMLEKEDEPAFFAIHLRDRPVAIEWHRFYQQRVVTIDPDHDVAAEYRALLEAEPSNGALAYLFGRVAEDHATQGELWQRALAANPPCYYAYIALGYDALTESRFDESLAFFDKARDAGVASSGLAMSRRQALLAAGRGSEALAELVEERKAKPHDTVLADEQITIAFAVDHDFAAASRMRDEFVSNYKKAGPPPEYVENVEMMLGATIASLSEDQETFGHLLAKAKPPYYQFRGAVMIGDLDEALKIANGDFNNDADSHLLVLLLASRKGDTVTAESQFTAACTAMAHGSPDERIIAVELAKAHPDVAAICGSHIGPSSKRILLTALATRFPADREAYFAMAKRMNFNPAFPQRFLNESLQEPAAVTRL